MKITIAKRLKPFSHQPGATCLLPFTTWQVRVFPTRVEMMPVGGEKKEQVVFHLFLEGPVEGFTVELDLEQGKLRVFGQTQQGYLCYEIHRILSKIALRIRKCPSDFAIACTGALSFPRRPVSAKEEVQIYCTQPETWNFKSAKERLCFGVHKAQEWEDLWRRADLKEIFPLLLRLSELVALPDAPCLPLPLLQTCIEQRHLGQWVKAVFSGMLVPRWRDEDFQGIIAENESVVQEGSPLSILKQGGKFIRSLFFQEKGSEWSLLPSLLPCFPAGRLTDLTVERGERIALEWSKHRLQKVVIQTSSPQTVHLRLPREIGAARLRYSPKDRGQRISVVDERLTLDLPEAKGLLLDRFTKRSAV